ncbi:MAG TPA: ATP-binding protein [Mariniphaga anaerophila]|uniref:ATP-binding protein n=1 Tax=Mariniphaga anaerophila TaxID=1484053 RepID=A0A831PIT5_9BACT|nr:ATP-binding protein [Mariniphaga anaerophila]
MNKERLQEIVFDQKETFNQKRNLIQRKVNLDSFIKTSLIVVISGIRRCGKSSLLYLIKEKMKLQEQDYCYFNFDDERIIPALETLDQIYNLHIELFAKEPVLFLDEIQNVKGWEKFVNRIHEKGIKIFVSGSNANLLSSEISTSLTGRNKVLELFPFSFSEFLLFIGEDYNLEKLTSKRKALLLNSFYQYLEFGGFPLVVKEKDMEIINGYFQDILYRDIISRFKLSQIDEIKQIGLYFASNIGKIFSYATLQKISGVKSTSSIKDYLSYYEQSYLFFYLKKFDYSVKKQIMNPKKVYTIDPAISNRLGFRFSENRGRILENLIFTELRRRGKEVFYHSGKNECDFLIKKGFQITEAIQVSWSIDKINIQREIKGLEEAIKAYDLSTGTLITAEPENTELVTDKTIKVVPAWKWLLCE